MVVGVVVVVIIGIDDVGVAGDVDVVVVASRGRPTAKQLKLLKSLLS